MCLLRPWTFGCLGACALRRPVPLATSCGNTAWGRGGARCVLGPVDLPMGGRRVGLWGRPTGTAPDWGPAQVWHWSYAQFGDEIDVVPPSQPTGAVASGFRVLQGRGTGGRRGGGKWVCNAPDRPSALPSGRPYRSAGRLELSLCAVCKSCPAGGGANLRQKVQQANASPLLVISRPPARPRVQTVGRYQHTSLKGVGLA